MNHGDGVSSRIVDVQQHEVGAVGGWDVDVGEQPAGSAGMVVGRCEDGFAGFLIGGEHVARWSPLSRWS